VGVGPTKWSNPISTIWIPGGIQIRIQSQNGLGYGYFGKVHGLKCERIGQKKIRTFVKVMFLVEYGVETGWGGIAIAGSVQTLNVIASVGLF